MTAPWLDPDDPDVTTHDVIGGTCDDACLDCGGQLDEAGICQACTPGDYLPPEDVSTKDGLL